MDKVKKVTVEFKFENVCREDENEMGVLFPDGHVLVADAIGGISIYHSYPSSKPGFVMVDLDNDKHDLAIDNPELTINLILSGNIA